MTQTRREDVEERTTVDIAINTSYAFRKYTERGIQRGWIV